MHKGTVSTMNTPAGGTCARTLMLTCCAIPGLLAQESRATITGTVVDPQGAAIPGATVTARQLATNAERTTATSEAGLYVLPFLTTGAYSVTVTAPGFKSAVGDRLELGISERKQLDFKMEI